MHCTVPGAVGPVDRSLRLCGQEHLALDVDREVEDLAARVLGGQREVSRRLLEAIQKRLDRGEILELDPGSGGGAPDGAVHLQVSSSR
ncbi:MAG: hypothetical protein GX960_16095 [Actinomycetales bacterium]|nr:hypothetical protein [Actinomycetales bacterium]